MDGNSRFLAANQDFLLFGLKKRQNQMRLRRHFYRKNRSDAVPGGRSGGRLACRRAVASSPAEKIHAPQSASENLRVVDICGLLSGRLEAALYVRQDA